MDKKDFWVINMHSKSGRRNNFILKTVLMNQVQNEKFYMSNKNWKYLKNYKSYCTHFGNIL